jgi:hypothetical protein
VVARKPGGGDAIRLMIEGTGGDAANEQVAERFRRQTLVSADEIDIVAELPDGPLLVDERGA